MRFSEIDPPSSHPHILRLHLDPLDACRLWRMVEDSTDGAVKLLNVDNSKADVWIVLLACASVAVRDALDGVWG